MTDDARPGGYLAQVIKQRDEARAERDSFAAGVSLVCCDGRHEAKVRSLEARIAAALAVVDRFDEYLLRRDAVADLRDALNGSAAGGERDAV